MRYLTVFLLFIGLSAQAQTAPDKNLASIDFVSGLSAGLIQSHEGNIFNAYTAIKMLEGTKDPKVLQFTDEKIIEINTNLYAISQVINDVQVKPELLKILIVPAIPIMKDFMANLSAERTAHGWKMTDAKMRTLQPQMLTDDSVPAMNQEQMRADMEQKIQETLDRYIQTGNIFGFESK